MPRSSYHDLIFFLIFFCIILPPLILLFRNPPYSCQIMCHRFEYRWAIKGHNLTTNTILIQDHTTLYSSILYYPIRSDTVRYNIIPYNPRLKYIVSYYKTLFSTNLYTILHYPILYYNIRYGTIPYCAILTILYYTIPYYTILYYTILYCGILYYTILC